MDMTLKLENGAEFECTSTSYVDVNKVMLMIRDNISKVAAEFSNEANLARIVVDNGNTTQIITGYNQLDVISQSFGLIMVILVNPNLRYPRLVPVEPVEPLEEETT